MGGLLKALAKESNLSFIALAVLCAIIWFGGEYFQIEKSLRILAILVVLGLWLILYVAQKLMAVRAAMMIEKRLRAQAETQKAMARPDRKPEIEALEKQFDEALQALKTSRLGKSALYAMPWYMIIGPPGVGKTTALLESGLNFSYMNQQNKLRGLGGTKNCDWWFTDRGILLDTAGRYTSVEDDREEWFSFLDTLRKVRKKKPINGVLVAVSVADLLKATESELEEEANRIRERIDELTKRLEVVFPVYVLFTKCDLLGGFVSFFEDLSKSERTRVWGSTLRFTPGEENGEEGSIREVFEGRSRDLYLRLCGRRVRLLSRERPPDRMLQIFSFPLQFGLARRRLAEFLEILFRPNPYQETSVLRGFYFTSGTQEGKPIDQVVGAMSAAFGLEETTGDDGAGGAERKSYFIHDLFTEVVFPDQHVARSSARRERQARWLRRGAATASLAASAALIILLLISFFANRSLVHSVGSAAASVRAAEGQDLPARLAALDELREQVERLDHYERESLPLHLRWGLYRGGSLNPAVRGLYFGRLHELIVRPLGERLERELEEKRKNERKTSEQYEELSRLFQVYLMLAGSSETAKAKPELLLHALRAEDRWKNALGSSLPEREALDSHLSFFASQLGREDVPRIQRNPVLVEDVRRNLLYGEWITEAFTKMEEEGKRRFPDVTPASLVPGEGGDLFRCEREKDHVPGVFTRRGYTDFVRDRIPELTRGLAQMFRAIGASDQDIAEIERRLTEIYENRYRETWRRFLENMKLVEFQGLEGAYQALSALSADDSPYKQLFREFWKGSQLPTGPLGGGALDTTWLDRALEGIRKLRFALYGFRSETSRGQRFTPSVDEAKFGELQGKFTAAGPAIEEAVDGLDPPLKGGAERLLRKAIEGARDAVVSECRWEADTYWREKVYSFYEAKLESRFPFARDLESEDASLENFSEFLQPEEGIFWKARAALRKISEKVILQEPLVSFSPEFQDMEKKARALTDALFAQDAERISVKFALRMEEVREGVVDVWFSVGGKPEFRFQAAAGKAVEMVWNGGPSALTISVGDQRNPRHSLKDRGPWGLLRLYQRGTSKQVGPRRFECMWIFKDIAIAAFPGKNFPVDAELLPATEPSIFEPGLFESFRCPERVSDRPLELRRPKRARVEEPEEP